MSQKIKIYETSISLLIAYETLAISYKKYKAIRIPLGQYDSEPEREIAKSPDYMNFNQSFALLILNASIVEGTIRTILSELITSDNEYEIEKGKAYGQRSASRTEGLLHRFRGEVEHQGGWDKLKGQYKQYLNISLDNLVGEEVKNGMNALFFLRNVLAHGTAIIQPSAKMGDELRDEYPFTWQSKTHGVDVYLKSQFGNKDIFENLAEYEMPEHFLNVTKKYFAEIEKNFPSIPERAKKTIDMFKAYHFGYIYYTR